MNRKKHRQSLGEYIFDFVNMGFLVIFALITLIPVFFVFSIAFRPEIDLIKYGQTLFPQHIAFDAFIEIFSGKKILNAYMSTIFITVVGTPLAVFLTAITAYPLSKQYLPYNRIIMFMIYFTLLFGGGIVPFYLVVSATGLVDSLWSLIIPIVIYPWNVIIMRNFFHELPNEIEESARLDGASDFRILFKIVMPLSLPVLATIGLFIGIGQWNQWFLALIFINDKSKWTLQLLLREILAQGMTKELQEAKQQSGAIPPNETLKMAVTVVATVPIMCVYPFLQKYFAKGLIIGAVKG